MSTQNYRNTLLQGDVYETLEKMPENLVDLSITSPPYNKQEKNHGWLVSKVVYDRARDNMSEQTYQQTQIKVLDEIYRITKPGGSFFYNHKLRWVKGEMIHPIYWLHQTKWDIRQEIIWNRKIAGNIRGWRFWQIEERIYWLYKPISNNKIGIELESRDAKFTSVWEGVPENSNPHPAPFPIWIPARIIISFSRNKSRFLVFDPYIGSGTTAVAAKLLNCEYIGIDISKEYISYAKKRLEDIPQTEKEKIAKEKQLHIVKKTFKERKTEAITRKSSQLKVLVS